MGRSPPKKEWHNPKIEKQRGLSEERTQTNRSDQDDCHQSIIRFDSCRCLSRHLRGIAQLSLTKLPADGQNHPLDGNCVVTEHGEVQQKPPQTTDPAWRCQPVVSVPEAFPVSLRTIVAMVPKVP